MPVVAASTIFDYCFLRKLTTMPAHSCAFNCMNQNIVAFRHMMGIKF